MKLFSEFIKESYNIIERYYEPDEPLPSGKTPYGKAVSSFYRNKGKANQNERLKDRVEKQRNRVNNEVIRGADNPNMDYDKKPSASHYSLTGSHDKKLTVTDRKNNIVMNVSRGEGSDSSGNTTYDVTNKKDPVYDVTWSRTSGRRHDLGTARNRQLLRSVKDLWDKEVTPRLPHGAILSNSPVKNKTSNRNTRSKLYTNSGGFGNTGSTGRQFARVGRTPSPRQQEKGKSRIQPLSGDTPITQINRKELQNLDNQRKPRDLDYWADKRKQR